MNRQKRYWDSEQFQELELIGEEIEGMEFSDCTFQHCMIDGCVISRCKFSDCQFVDCRISNVRGNHANMIDTGFTSCYLAGINWSEFLSSGKFIVPINHFEDCQLKYNQFTENNFSKFNFAGNRITGSLFADCNLTESKFSSCDLENTEFFRSNLTKADFRGASGYIVDIGNNKLKGAKFSFPEVVNLLNGLGIVIE